MASVSYAAQAKRVVSLYAGHTENLIAIGARGRIVGVSDTDDPDFTASLPRMPQKPGIEQIIALKPDLVVMRTMQARSQEGLVRQLEGLGVRVLVLDPPELAKAEFIGYFKKLGASVGMESLAVGKAEAAYKKLTTARVKNPAGVFLLTNGRTYSSCGSASWASGLIAAAGGRSMATGDGVVVPFGLEKLVQCGSRVDAIIVQNGVMNSVTASQVMADPRLASVKAVVRGKVYNFSEADISRPSLLRYESSVAALRRLLAK